MGPLHWSSKRQTITACSSAEAEIYTTDECVKALLHISFLVDGLKLKDSIMLSPTVVYNDNSACVQWAVSLMSKGLRHIQIRENAVCEGVQNKFVTIKHIEGKKNPLDIFTKEDKEVTHFLKIPSLLQDVRCNLVFIICCFP